VALLVGQDVVGAEDDRRAGDLGRDVREDRRLDADSTQLAAMASALDGKSFVLQGPPGTGKSQTITNLVAASLARGKTVLFVSEKMAALEVVHRRLRDVGLADFCLELHSHKANKGPLGGRWDGDHRPRRP
jgi:primosomal protein N'